MAEKLEDLFFGVDVVNRTGRKNIRGDELAALIAAAAGGPSAQVGKGALVQRAPSETITNGFPGVAIIWTGFPNPVYDDLGFWSAGDPTKLTIPDVDPPIERIILVGNGIWSSDSSSAHHIELKKNGVTNEEAGLQGNQASADVPVSTQYTNATGGPYSVVAGDFFELFAIQHSSPAASKTLARATLSLTVVK